MDFLFLVLWPFPDGGKGPEPETDLDAKIALKPDLVWASFLRASSFLTH
jgi:hypothetical protein